MFSGKYGVSRPFYFFIQPTYWFDQQVLTLFQFRWSYPTAYALQSDEERYLTSDFSEDAVYFFVLFVCITGEH